MLQSLHVKNLALIEETEVSFTDGLNILSGETGAGKSIIIGSIGIALGEKIPKDFVRENGKDALVELIFSVDELTKEKLLKLDVETEDDTVILSRKISAGHSRARVNDETVTATRLKQIASLLIDVHGQHEHQSLLNSKTHIKFLDKYQKNEIDPVLHGYEQQYKNYTELVKELSKTEMDEETREREISFLRFEIEEIEDAALQADEDIALEADYKRLLHGQKIMEAVGNVKQQMGEMPASASELISRSYKDMLLVAQYDDKLDNLAKQLCELDSLSSDFLRDLDEYCKDADYEEEKLQNTGERLDVINRLKSKYGKTIPAILSSCEEKKEKLAKLLDFEETKRVLQKQLKESEESLRVLAKELSDCRKKAGAQLDEVMTRSLLELNFLDVRFQTNIKQREHFEPDGVDEVSFFISLNPGEELKPLENVASGGELSRIMLALKTILADQDEIKTLIFDEIDAGISGRTAQAVSVKLHAIATSHQVICITHLPQIAAMADTHFLIEKTVDGLNTISTINVLTKEESVMELARMLGGAKITEAVIQNAREMKMLAKEEKLHDAD